jgi:D-lactate dehydrogenase
MTSRQCVLHKPVSEDRKAGNHQYLTNSLHSNPTLDYINMKVAVFSAQPYDKRFLEETNSRLFANHGFELTYHEFALSQETASLAQGCGAVCVFVNDTLDAPVLKELHKHGTRAVLLRCAGFNNVDLKTADALGLFVARVSAYSPEAVAEFTTALMLTLNRHTHRAYNRVREGNFSLDGMLGFTMHGKTVGIIGTGKIGMAVANILNGFGCRLLAYDPSQVTGFAKLGEYTTLESLLKESDIITLHCPLTDSTRHIINKSTLELMKPSVMLVNSSRGGLIDTVDVIAALKARKLGALAIDVYEQEGRLFYHDHSADIIDDDVFQRLMTFPNVLVSGHQGFFTTEALTQIAEVTLRNMEDFVTGAPCSNRIVGS